MAVLAPHIGFFDSMFFAWSNLMSTVARTGTEETPFFGTLTKVCKPIIVNRDTSTSRSNTVQKIIDRMNKVGTPGLPPLCLFPQGTCSNQKAMVRFKPGAFIAGMPVQPVCLRYSNLNFDSVTWSWEG